jgi:transposase-like protein
VATEETRSSPGYAEAHFGLRAPRVTDMVAAVFRTVFAQPDATTVAATWDEVRDQLATRFPEIGPLMDEAKAVVLAFTAFPRALVEDLVDEPA